MQFSAARQLVNRGWLVHIVMVSIEHVRTAASKIKRIGFISPRIAGTDGVSLETLKWAKVLKSLGYETFFIAGELEEKGKNTYCIKEAALDHPEILKIQKQCFAKQSRPHQLSKAINDSLVRIKGHLYRCQKKMNLDLWIAENCLSLPMNIPLGLALTEFIAETSLPCVAHHHDFYWERERYASTAVSDYLHAAFPPKLPSVTHVVINSVANAQLGFRLGLSPVLIPNVMDFENPPSKPDKFAQGFRRDIGVTDDEWLILQPTRVVMRKKIEHSIELVKRLDDPRAQLVVTHSTGDEGTAYFKYLQHFANMLGVKMRFVHEWIGEHRRKRGSKKGRKQYALTDVYHHADLVTYPSDYEGFGNAFLEAVYNRKPVVCNRYSIYRTDIEPKGFEAVPIEGFVTDDTVKAVKAVLEDKSLRRKMVERNYELGKRFFSYAVLERKLKALLSEIAGVPTK